MISQSRENLEVWYHVKHDCLYLVPKNEIFLANNLEECHYLLEFLGPEHYYNLNREIECVKIGEL